MKRASKMMASALVTTLVATGLALGSVGAMAKEMTIKEIPQQFWGVWKITDGGNEPDGSYNKLTFTRNSVQIDKQPKEHIVKISQPSSNSITLTLRRSKANGGDSESTYTVRGNKLVDADYADYGTPFTKQR